MKLFTVHFRMLGREAEMVLVKEGFCWPAFIFSALWALWNRLWLVAAGLVLVEVALDLILQALNAGSGLRIGVTVALALFVGVFANDLRRLSLGKWGGYREIGVAAGDRVEDAEYRFLASRPDVLLELS
jgi:hypothetical protein